jgi:hypothetical protein
MHAPAKVLALRRKRAARTTHPQANHSPGLSQATQTTRTSAHTRALRQPWQCMLGELRARTRTKVVCCYITPLARSQQPVAIITANSNSNSN